MGDFSRDTFKLTNALHQLLTGETVADPKHYVGVRVQQGVPLIDADLNELEDIRSMELRAILRYFIGNGVPTNSDGFRISASGDANNFAINPGIILIEGLLAINLHVATYANQPANHGLPALTTPMAGTDRTDVVYLDVWHAEVGATGTSTVDARLVNEHIGVETAIRIGRQWQVRVRENANDLSGLTISPGHWYIPLAQFRRLTGTAAIRENMIIDLRKVGITLADNLKVPIDLRRGLEVLNIQRFVQMLKGLRTTLFTLLKNNQLPYSAVAPQQKNETLLLMALQQLLNQAHIGEAQALSRNMDNEDALKFMGDLYASQKAWVDILAELGNQGGVAQTFIDDYLKRLNGDAATLVKGLKPALDRSDLLAAVIAQEELNLWLTAPIGNLPQGEVVALYRSVIPFELLQAGSYAFTYDIAANFTSPQANEEFTVQVTLPAGFGSAIANPASLTFAPPSGQQTVIVTVNISGAATSADLDVAVISVRNATLRSSQPPITLIMGALPPIGTFFFYTGPRLNADGRLEIPQNHLTRPQGRNISFRLRNDSPGQNRTYQVTGQIVPVGNTSGWSPLNPTPLPPNTLAPSNETDVLIRVDGPKPPAAPAPIGTTGNIITSAVLTAIDGSPPPEAQTPATITIPFVVV